MSRFLFVVPPLAGHTFPTVAVGQELAGRGHTVAWAGNPRYLSPLLPTGATVIPVGTDIHHKRGVQPHRAHSLRGAAALKFLWQDYLIPLAHSMVPGTAAAAEEFRPDVMVVDQQALAGALVARQRRLPWVTSATTSAELTDQFATMPRLGDWVRQRIDEFQLECGASHPVDLRFSDDLLLAFTSEALVGPGRIFPGHYV
ncbi:MAG: glycosyltransferase, partial [Pseudonocardiaceae bacterium]